MSVMAVDAEGSEGSEGHRSVDEVQRLASLRAQLQDAAVRLLREGSEEGHGNSDGDFHNLVEIKEDYENLLSRKFCRGCLSAACGRA